MADLAMIMSMMTVTNTAAGILGVIKRRCCASQTITRLVSKCAHLVGKIRILLRTLEGDAQMPRVMRRISTALKLRREEFNAVSESLEKMKIRTKRTHPIDRTEKFIKAQGWAKSMDGIHNDLVDLRNGIENIVSNWDVVEFVATKFDEVATINATKKERTGKWEQYEETTIMETGIRNYVDRMRMTMVKLTDANKEALNRYSAPSLQCAGFWVISTSLTANE